MTAYGNGFRGIGGSYGHNKKVWNTDCGITKVYRRNLLVDSINADTTRNTAIILNINQNDYKSEYDNGSWLNQGAGLEADSMEGAYDLKEMRRVVNALPKDYRIPFAMYVSGFKYREIADKLGLPLGTVKSRIYFTRQRLQEELKDFR